MKYNFDSTLNRRGSGSLKWDASNDPDVLPMWVADMDFQSFPGISDALREFIEQGTFGYTLIPDRFYLAIQYWWKGIHGQTIEKEWILPTTGTIPSLKTVISVYADAGDQVIMQSPVYDHFFTLMKQGEYQVVLNPLKHHQNAYEIDFVDLERKAADPKAKVLLLCNPHNPVGRAWSVQELERIASIASAHQLVVISDEIHADLVYPDHIHTPFFSVSQPQSFVSVSCASPSKTFSISGLPVGYIIAPDTQVRETLSMALARQGTAHPNLFASQALIAAYETGGEWLAELKDYLYANYQYLLDFCSNHLPQLKVSPLQATYLVWLDCRGFTSNVVELTNRLKEEDKVWLNPGTLYGPDGEGFLRINIACSQSMLKEGLARLKKGIDKTV